MCTVRRPDLSYNDLIRTALLSKPNHQATLAQIYDFIQMTFPFYNDPKGCRFWKNSVRHNLCRNSLFMRVESKAVDKKGRTDGRGQSSWQLCDSNMSNPQPRKRDRPVRKRKPKANKVPTRPSSVETSSGDVYSSQYPWQPRSDTSHPGQSSNDCALDLSTNPGQMSLLEPDSLTHHQAFLQPWSNTNHLTPYYSHFEAPHPEELASHTSEKVVSPQSLYPQVWFPGDYRDVTVDALRGASPALPSPVPSHNPHLLQNQQCMYANGIYYYPQLCPNQQVSMATSS
ncbi:forkhead box protein O1-like [Asterias rubens]|uniref:forkhead box protein O1-like n=1 Tax=Asterias rubens TaxID=7604 RepID=UPI001455699A|nr:forkhead box protein O1-like [Asterias rubens]XP_033631958.1 forkhead box protein O1-like [Asterias rubens]